MKRPALPVFHLCCAAAISLTSGGAPSRSGFSASAQYTFLYPVSAKAIVMDNVFQIIMKIDHASISRVVVYTPWDTTMSVDLTMMHGRENLLKSIAASLPSDLLLKQIIVQSAAYHQSTGSCADYFDFSQKKLASDMFLNDTMRSSIKALREFVGNSSSLQVGGWVSKSINTDPSRQQNCRGDVVAQPVVLMPGLNRIPIEFLSGNALVGSDTVLAFYRADLGSSAIPEGFTRQAFHKCQEEAQCTPCHQAPKSVSDTSGTALQCASCHGTMASQFAVHGPFAANDCGICHDMGSGSGYAPNYPLPHENERCFGCHDNIGQDVKRKSVVHTPLIGGQCGACHSPHASPFVHQLRKTVNEICFSCHNEKREGNHPVVFHPVSGPVDPRVPAKELRCTSCHNPHASENKSLLATPGGYFALCQSCHQK